MIDLTLTDEQRILRDTIVRFAQSELNGDVMARDQRSTFDHQAWLKCGNMGLQGLPVPETFGGMGLDPVSTVVALEALGYGCHDGGLTFSICAHLLACVIPIWKHGSADQRERYLPDLCSGRLIAVNAMTEADSGSDAFGMSTTAEPSDEGYLINGSKTFNSNAPIADLAVVYAMTDRKKGYMGGTTAFLVEKNRDGFVAGQRFDKMGLRTSQIGELVLDNVYVPSTAVLGRVGGGGAMFAESMDWERACLVASHVGTMERLLEKAIDYAKTRKQFGQPIGKNQAVSHKLADMKVRLEASRLLTYNAALSLAHGRGASLNASMTKLFASEALLETALDTVQVFGGYGFMTEYEVERAVRDAVGSRIYSGTSEMQRNIIASWLGL